MRKHLSFIALIFMSFILFNCNVYAGYPGDDATFKYEVPTEINSIYENSKYVTTIPVKIITKNNGNGLGGYTKVTHIKHMSNAEITIEDLKSDYISEVEVNNSNGLCTFECILNQYYEGTDFNQDMIVAEYNIVIKNSVAFDYITFSDGSNTNNIKVNNLANESNSDITNNEENKSNNVNNNSNLENSFQIWMTIVTVVLVLVTLISTITFVNVIKLKQN